MRRGKKKKKKEFLKICREKKKSIYKTNSKTIRRKTLFYIVDKKKVHDAIHKVCIKMTLNVWVPFHAHKSLLIEEKSTVKQSFNTFYHL